MSKLTIFRGLPGSGKSTAARLLAERTGAILIEPDALLIVNGEYQYTPERYEEAVYRCKLMMQTLTCNDTMEADGSDFLLPDLIYADVLPRRSDVREIINCLDYPYDVEVASAVCTVEESIAHNIHRVRVEDIKRMARDWEEWV